MRIQSFDIFLKDVQFKGIDWGIYAKKSLKYFIWCAQNGISMNYTDFAKEVYASKITKKNYAKKNANERTSQSVSHVGKIAGAIGEYCQKNKLPMLNLLLIHKNGKRSGRGAEAFLKDNQTDEDARKEVWLYRKWNNVCKTNKIKMNFIPKYIGTNPEKDFDERVRLALTDKDIGEYFGSQEKPIKKAGSSNGYYIRDPKVVAACLIRAKWICQECKKTTFKAIVGKCKGHNFLEVHHIISLSKGGLDNIKNTIALCPNCHRKKHYGM